MTRTATSAVKPSAIHKIIYNNVEKYNALTVVDIVTIFIRLFNHNSHNSNAMCANCLRAISHMTNHTEDNT